MPSVDKNTFMFIPDLNGYTRYMSEVDNKRGRIIVEQLLDRITDQNNLGLEISDILGDAIFYFRVGTPPDFSEIITMCNDMILAAHEHLNESLDELGINVATVKAFSLSLKFVCHYGQARHSVIKGHSQLIGKATIEAHQLLKNSVELQNYLLISKDCLDACSDSKHLKDQLIHGSDVYDHIGELDYKVCDLSDQSKWLAK